MARRDKVDRVLGSRLEELERRMFLLKMEYEKYFSGLINIEPVRERDDMKRMIRNMLQDPIRSTAQRYKFQQLRARWNVLDLYLTRQVNMVERGTHPKFKFRADANERRRAHEEERRSKAKDYAKQRRDTAQREDRAFRQIYDRYMEARDKCGQSNTVEYEQVQKVLRSQVKTIKSKYRCKSVSFKVTVEDGKARLKAVPKR